MNANLVPTSSPRPYLVPTSSRDEVNDELKFPRPLVPPLYKGTRDEDEVDRGQGRASVDGNLVPAVSTDVSRDSCLWCAEPAADAIFCAADCETEWDEHYGGTW